MSHQCIKCGRSYPDESNDILQGCFCGGKAFYFIKDIISNNELSSMLPDIKNNDELSNSVDHRDVDETRLEGPLGTIGYKDDVSAGYALIDVDELLHKEEVIFSPEEGKYTVNVEAILSGQRPKL